MTQVFRTVIGSLFVAAGFSLPALAIPFENPVHDAWNPALSPAFQTMKDASTDTSGIAPLDAYHGYDVATYDLNVHFDAATSALAGTNTIVFRSKMDHLGTLILDAVDMDITGVRWSDGSTLLTTYDQKQLKITLPYALQQNFVGKLTVAFTSKRSQALRIAAADATRKDRVTTAYTFTEPDGSRRWFPCHDIPSDKTVTTMTFSSSQNFIVASNGDEYELERGPGGRRRFRFETGVPIATYLTSVVLGPLYSEQIGMLRNIPLTITGPQYLMPAFRAEANRTLKMMQVFERFTQTRYGFQKYRQTVAEGYSGSMEHQSVTTMGGNRVVGDLSGESVIAHELAHQWFGDLVTCGIWGDIWLNEGFASYLPLVFYESMQERDRWILNYLGSYGWYFGSTNADNARAISTPEEWPNYNIFDQHSYAKASMVLHLFRHIANGMVGQSGGVEPFSRALGLYLQEHAYGNGRYFDLQRALEKATGASWTSLFDQWILHKGHPDVKVDWNWDKDSSSLTLAIIQMQTDPNDARHWGHFSFPLGIKAIDEQGQAVTEWQWVDQPKQTFKIKAAKKIMAVTVDPDFIVPGTFVITQPASAFAAAFASAKHETEQASILETLMHTYPSDADLAPVFKAIVDQTENPLALALVALKLQNHDGLVDAGQQLIEKAKTKTLTTHERPAITGLEAWLIKKAKPESRPTFASLQDRWRKTVRVEERESLIEVMQLVDVQATHSFALAELAKPQWTDRDRAALAKSLASVTTSISRPFILDMLKNAQTTSVAGTFFSAALSQKFSDPEALPLLIKGATTHQSASARGYYVRLIPFQKDDKAVLCGALAKIKEKTLAEGSETDKRIVNGEVTSAESTLKCQR